MSNLPSVLRRLRGVVVRRCDGGLDDAQLLQRFAGQRDEAAFEVLVWRHGPMVLGVGRRVLHNADDAEDVLQATFLALARKAPSISRGEALAGWLYRVAYRVALQARRQRTQHPVGQDSLDAVPAPPPVDEPWRDVWPALDEELQRLPDKYRIPLVLSYLQGLTNREVAEQLACPLGTVFTRLARGRELLRRRLSRRGVTLPAGLIGTALAAKAATAPLRAAVVQATARAAVLFAAGTEAVAGLLSPSIIDLTEGAIHMLGMSRLRVVWVSLIVLAIAGPGAALLAWGGTAREPENTPQQAEKAGKAAEAPSPPPREALRYGGKDFQEWRRLLRIDLDPVTRVQGIKALAAFGTNGYGPEAAAAILDVVRGYNLDALDGEDAKVVEAAGKGLAKIGTEAVPVLVEEMKHGRKNERQFALAEALPSLRSTAKAAIPAAITALRDEDPDIRRIAVNALRSIDPEGTSAPAMARVVTDDDADIRYRAMQALAGWGPKARVAAPQLLAAAVKDPNPGWRRLALTTLDALKLDAATLLPALEEALKDKDGKVRQQAIATLGTLGAEARDAVPGLVAVLKRSDNLEEHVQILETLAAMGPAAKAAVPALKEMMSDPKIAPVRGYAARALEKIRPLTP
jgi:RNA polymerase sigma factor (sigma-70 family)